MVGKCQLDSKRLKVWVDAGVRSLSLQSPPDPYVTSHWDEIDPGWVMPWDRARRALNYESVPGDEAKHPGYSFEDAVAVFVAIRDCLPPEWPGVITHTVPLHDSESRIVEPPVFTEIVPNWWEPPAVYLASDAYAPRMVVGWAFEEFRSGYLELPAELRDGRTNVLFRSGRHEYAREKGLDEYVNEITIVGLR